MQRTILQRHDHTANLISLRMQKGMGQMTNVNELRRVRRDIARVKTVMTEKSTEGNAA